MKRLVPLMILITSGANNPIEARHTGAAVAGGILGGVLLTKALERPRPSEVIVVDGGDSYAEDYPHLGVSEYTGSRKTFPTM